MAKLDRMQIEMLKMVIEAARDGRYLHGNGAIWVFLKKGTTNMVVTVDHVSKTVSYSTASESAKYLSGNRAHRDENTAKSLETFIKQSS